MREQLVAGVTEEPLGLSIDEHDFSATIDDDHSVGRRLKKIAELPLGYRNVHAFRFALGFARPSTRAITRR